MALSREELGRRLRMAREARGLTQDQVAQALGLSRPTIAQMELGNRGVSSLELEQLADLFGRDLREFFADSFQEQDALAALFRADVAVTEQAHVVDALRACATLGREATNLEQLLGVDRGGVAGAVYPLPPPRNRWQAVQQAERVAAEERKRLGLGAAPIASLSELLESQGVRTALIDLPDDISGLTLADANMGVFVVANRRHASVRRRFSVAHEYCHALLDRQRLGTVSRTTERDDLLEVRANTFAAAFLLPVDGVRQFIALIGKGAPSRQRADVFDEGGVIEASMRVAPRSQEMQLYDIAELAGHFGVSRMAALYRLRNLRLLSDKDFDDLKSAEDAGHGRAIASLLHLVHREEEDDRDEYRHRFLSLALEAFRRGAISRAKFTELAALVDLTEPQVTEVLERVGFLDSNDVPDVMLPAE